MNKITLSSFRRRNKHKNTQINKSIKTILAED